MSLKKFCLLSVLLLACVLLGACENEAEEDGANHADRHPTMETFSKELELQHDTVVEAIVTYGPGLTLTIGDEEEQVSEDFFAKLGVEATPAIDLHVMDQEGRTNKIILLTVETADPTYGSNVHLWAFEYHDIGRRLRSIWALENESVPVEITYNITGSKGNYEIRLHESLHGSRTSEPLAIDKQTYEQIDADGMLQGKLELSAPIDFLLDDVIGYNQQAEFIVRRQLIGDKPDWFPYKDVMMAYFARRGQMIPRTRSEEHTSELQSRGHLVCRLLLEKKNQIM